MQSSNLKVRWWRLSLALLAVLPLIGCATTDSQFAGQGQLAVDGQLVESGKETEQAVSSKPQLLKDAWVASDGESFPFTRWGPASSPQTVVVAVHGLSGAASDFRPLGEFLSKRSTAVYSYALRGQGLDPVEKRRGDIEDPALWYADLDTFLGLVREANPRSRLFLYGESLGGLISVHGFGKLSEANRKVIRGLVLASPVVSLKDRDKAGPLKYAILKGAIKVAPRKKITLEKLAGDKVDMKITGDADHRENIRNTPHAVDQFSFRLLGTLEKLIDGLTEKAEEIELPVLVLYPAHDLLTRAEDVESWFDRLKSGDKEKHLFSESYHMLLHDKERGAVLDNIAGWLDRH